MKVNKSIKVAFCVFLIAVFGLIVKVAINHARADILANGTKVQPYSELTYYLNVKYDGVDKYGTSSSDNATAEITSGYIAVKDKLPVGLEFQNFVETEDGSIGAVTRDEGLVCNGRVVDDTGDVVGWNEENTKYTYHGLHYDKETNEVTFKVKNLKAGCVLTVGITTMTPTIDNPETDDKETRRDFYNYANALEDNLGVNSNLAHVYMGDENVARYNVTYEYTGTIPEGAPSVPDLTSHVSGEPVAVASNASLGGYTFSGWTTEDITVEDGKFLMPEKNVVFRGSFTKDDIYKVSYSINGTKPDNYVKPSDKDYYEDATVKVDRLKKGSRVGNYEFNGWTSEDVTVSDDGDFVMPNKNVSFVGTFKEVKHTVTYRFYDTVLPPNADSLLPETKEYHTGDKVKLTNPENVQGYEFLGWYKEDNFEMPDEDIIVYGEWKRKNGEFTPEITKTIDNKKDLYKSGDTINFSITVKNKENYDIKDVIVKEMDDNAVFSQSNDYNKETDHIIKIDKIKAGESVSIKSSIKVTDKMTGNNTNTVKVIGALADNYYELSDSDITASANYNVAKSSNIRVPITGKSSKAIAVMFVMIALSSLLAGLYIYKFKKN